MLNYQLSIILPRCSHVTELINDHFHERVKHQGKGMTMNEIRSYGIWILGLNAAVASHIYKCVQCRRQRRPTEGQKMADLPEDRVESTPPFTYCGMDCFGPFTVKERRKELKRYAVIFTCMSSRAVHIEQLDDMTTDAFINALRCFTAIRWPIQQIRSDQGSNCVGARNELAKAMKGQARKTADWLKKIPLRACSSAFRWPYADAAGSKEWAIRRSYNRAIMNVRCLAEICRALCWNTLLKGLVYNGIILFCFALEVIFNLWLYYVKRTESCQGNHVLFSINFLLLDCLVFL